jgi:serine/threonine protein kinase
MDLSSYSLDEEVEAFLNEQKDFLIDRVSQEGGNCDIFFGYHKIFERRIALKVYYGNHKSISHYEPRILSQINHDNILKVRDAKRIGEHYSYFMTDEISGGDLEKCYLAEELDLKQKLNIIHGILNGLTELHSDGVSIVHRDLKPKNILIYSDTKEPLISDFGSIKQFDVNVGCVTGSKTTLIYTPKESFEDNKYTKQSDIYQVGVSMFQTLGGYFPGAYFDWLTEGEKRKFEAIRGHYEQTVFLENVIQTRVSKNTLLKFDSLPKYIDPKIVKIIRNSTHPKLNLRYSNTGEFMSELFKVQKRLTNWIPDVESYVAIKPNGDKYRVVKLRKGYATEKYGSGGWRRNSDFTECINSHFEQINSK